ncbi:MAG TPA: PQQ-binding-like beta-propeller repeat protein [Vicinamibacterales bacterium]|nr:PQQ-binding-like beta-propeller repeat protein [Vicinamibacterales bacterium]
MRMFVAIALVLVSAIQVSSQSAKGVKDWPMWGGSPDRNMVSDATGLATTWDVKTGKNIKWVAALGSQSYGNPVVANGVVLVGTNNEAMRDPKQPGDRGVLMAFSEATGEFLWQATSEKLSSGRANDWPFQGIASSPLIIGEKAYFMTNRAVLTAVDIRGFQDGENDGPFKDEKLTGKNDPDILWTFDTMEAVGNFPHNLANSSPTYYDNLLYISTGNGQDESHVNIPSPKAPSIVALDMTTGEPVWEDGSPGDKILHGQWSTPAVGTVGGALQVVHAQGDGWVRAYEAKTGKKLWEFDTNPKDSVWPKTRNEVIATPVIYDNVVYIANGQDPEHGEGVGHLYAIDATKRGDITKSGLVWHYDKIRRSISTASIKDGVIYVPDFSGFLHALDVKTGKPFWVHDMFAAMWSSTLVADGKIYLGDEDGDVVVIQHVPAAQIKPTEKPAPKILAENTMDSSVYSTVVTANGVMFIMTRNNLFAVQEGAQRK